MMNEILKKALFEIFEEIKRDTIEITHTPVEKGEGGFKSKIGGAPSVPKAFQWPYFESKSYKGDIANRPLSFLAQINLEEVAELDKENLLPKSGMLSFFYEMESQLWGFDPKDKGCAKVFYFEPSEILDTCAFPEDLIEDARFPEFSLTFEYKVGVPSYFDFSEELVKAKIPEAFEENPDICDYENYEEIRTDFGCDKDDWSEVTQLLGYPDVIQNPMEEQCEMVTRGIYCGGPKTLPEALESEIEKASKEWLLLFQMGTISNEAGKFELMFGDCGHIYFWIKKEDLAKKKFENSWLILQCG